jgi:hypothetical protein|tara:strand:+ start:2444 stop:2743 length:300 start_codon:yes stop_codon:yes gene_type:complete
MYLKVMKLPVVVVYKTTYRKKEKFHLKVFRDVYVDDVISTTKRKPLIPEDSEIVEIGVGSIFEERYMKKYKITKTIKEETTAEKTMRELQTIVNKQRGQ